MRFATVVVRVIGLPGLVCSVQIDQNSFQSAAIAPGHPLLAQRHEETLHNVSGAGGAEYSHKTFQRSPWGVSYYQLFHRQEPLVDVEEIEDALPDALVRDHALLTIDIAVFLLIAPAIVAIALTYLRPPALSKDATLRRYYGYLFFAHRNQTFAANLELSFRGAIGVLILAIPFIDPNYKDLMSSGYYTSTAAMLFVFTLYKTVGETLNFAFEGMLGTFFAVLNMWIMLGIFPQGVHEDSHDHVWWAAVIDGVLFVLIIVGMDLDVGCKMFALNWHCYFWMDFLNPHVTGVYSSGFTIDITGPAVSGLVQSAIGAGIAICATLLPFPLFALDKARDISLELADEMADAWDSGVQCFVLQKKDREAETKFRHDIESLVGNVSSMAGYASIAWWECLGIPGRPQTVREFLSELGNTITESYDRLKAVRHLCRVTERDEAHKNLMEYMAPYLQKLSEHTGVLLKTLVGCAIDGNFNDDEKALIEEQTRKVKVAMARLTDQYTIKRAELGEDHFHQSAMCLSYCSYARLTLDFETALKQDVERGKFFDNIKAWAQRFKLTVLTDHTERNCWIRSSTAILTCFFVGYMGYSAILPHYNATPAATVSLLLSSGLTSQATKNLERFEGVVLGIVFGQIAYALFAWCSLWGYIGVGLFLVFWTLPTFFLYYGTAEFSLRGCLLAAFGVVGVLRGCSDKVFQAGGSYNTVVGVVVAITIKVAVDSALAHSRASTQAINTLVSAFDQLQVAMTDFFSPEVDAINFKHRAIKDTFKYATSVSNDADHEPRLWWCAWKHGLFTDACKSGVRICEALSVLEAVFAKTGRSGSAKSHTLTSIQHLESCRKVNEDLLIHIDGLKHLCQEAFSYNKDGFFASEYKEPKALNYEGLHQSYTDLAKALSKDMTTLVSETGQDSRAPDDNDANLEYDIHCKISLFFICVEWMLEVMEEVHEALLSQ